MARLTGKVALITGAAGGQGTAEAELFVREEGAVVLTDIDAAAGESLAQRLNRRQGGNALFLRHDVADEAQWRETVAAALAHFGKLHILVNNAGRIARQGIADTTLEAWNRTLAVNLTGSMLGMKHCAPAIRDSGGGSIINISSAGFDQNRRATILAVEPPGQLDPPRTNRRHRVLPQRRRGVRPCRPHGNTDASAGHAKGMCRSGAVSCFRRIELYQRRGDRGRRRLYRRRHRQPPQSGARGFRRRPQLS